MDDSRASPTVVEATRVLRFGAWEYDLRAEELRKAGLRVRLPPQPLRVLLALLERPGDVVTRDELRQRLWAEDTFVDFDHGLNAAVKRLRTALGDDAENPRFVETVPLRGYRFIAPLADASGPHPPPSRSRTPWRSLAVGAAVLAALTSAILVSRTSPPEPEVVGARRVTQSGRVRLKVFGTATAAPFVTDGVRLYYTEVDPAGASRIAHVAVTGGESVLVPCSLSRPLVLALSSNGSELLVRDIPLGPDDEGPLFAVSSMTGALRRLGEIVAHDGAWSPDGKHLVYARNHELFLADAAGNGPVQRATVPGRAYWPRWSPDGRRLRFTVVDAGQDRSLWDLAVDDGSPPRPLFASGGEFLRACCGDWTTDGRLFVFSAFDGERSDAWGFREGRAPGEARPRRLTSGPLSFLAVVPGRDDRHLYLVGYEGRAELMKYDPGGRRLVARDGVAAEPSRDGQWIVWRDETGQGGIWRSRADGRDRLQLASPRMGLLMAPRWSPDGSHIAFAGREGH